MTFRNWKICDFFPNCQRNKYIHTYITCIHRTLPFWSMCFARLPSVTNRPLYVCYASWIEPNLKLSLSLVNTTMTPWIHILVTLWR